jgi:hypothetical protein
MALAVDGVLETTDYRKAQGREAGR